MVGDILRQERERQKLSIKDIERATSIRALYIEAIENSENDKLPGVVYTKGFIRNYANFLKLDAESLVKQFREEVSPASASTAPTVPEAQTQSNDQAAAPVQSESTIESTTEIKSTIPKVERKSPFNAVEEPSNKNSFMAVAAVLALAIVGGLYYYFTNIEGGELASAPITQTQTVEPSATPEPVEQPAATDIAAATNVASAAAPVDVLNLEARFTDRCWTKVTVDGAVVYEGTVEQGQSLSWTANSQIDVTAGNAGAIEFVENGVSLGVAGAIGDVIDRTFVRK